MKELQEWMERKERMRLSGLLRLLSGPGGHIAIITFPGVVNKTPVEN